MATCPHCDTGLPTSARYCPRCGRAVVAKVAGAGTAIAIVAILLVILLFILSVVRVGRDPNVRLPAEIRQVEQGPTGPHVWR